MFVGRVSCDVSLDDLERRSDQSDWTLETKVLKAAKYRQALNYSEPASIHNMQTRLQPTNQRTAIKQVEMKREQRKRLLRQLCVQKHKSIHTTHTLDLFAHKALSNRRVPQEVSVFVRILTKHTRCSP